MTEIIEIDTWAKMSTVECEGYSLTKGETVQDAIDQFTKKFGYRPEIIWVKGNQVRIEKREEK